MEILDALVLGLVQGLTEFIPVSSSGHLVLLDAFTPIESAFSFDVLINIGTLLALVLYFRETLANMYRRIVEQRDRRLLRNIVISTIPAVLAGGLFVDLLSTGVFREGYVTIAMLGIVGVIMVMLPKLTKQPSVRSLNDLLPKNAFTIGCAQALALIPGTSRSGVTIIAGRLSGFNYKHAAEYSFIISIPVLFGAILRSLLSSEGQLFALHNLVPLFWGNLVAFISSYLAISFMLGYLKKHGLAIFGYYRIALAAVLLLMVIFV